MLEILKRAAEYAGGVGKLAEAIGVARQNFYQWRQIPAERVIPIETATGGRIPRSEMRPDLWDPTAAPIVSEAERTRQFNPAPAVNAEFSQTEGGDAP